MENNLLFVNQNREIIREFLDAMKECTFEIDTADNGLDAAVLLRKKKYKVVITGVNLPSVDGSKLIAYLNQYCPQTVCIVYTRRLELAHLKLLVNERRVFRIFQKPADFKGEIYDAIQEAFEYYNVQEAEKQEIQILKQKLKNGQGNLMELGQAALEHKQEKRELASFLQTMLKVYVKSVKINLSREEKHLLCLYETMLMIQLLQEGSCDREILKVLKQEVYEKCGCVPQQKLARILEGMDRVALKTYQLPENPQQL